MSKEDREPNCVILRRTTMNTDIYVRVDSHESAKTAEDIAEK